jgi:hypothetical protein
VALSDWNNFYVIVGSSAAALTGLMFVTMALLAEFRASEHAIQAFSTPTVVHFGAVLLQSAIMAAPWPSLQGARIALSLDGIAGLAYTLVVFRRARQQTDYKPVFEDWLFHAALPFAGYGVLIAAAVDLPVHPLVLLFTIAGASLLLLFVGLHNAWDTVTYVVIARPGRNAEDKPGTGHEDRKARHR